MKVPVIDVNNDNFADVWPSMSLALKSATFVALDTELSGLGDKRALNARSIDDRYKTLTHVAKTRSIVSLGMSVFKFLPPSIKSAYDKGDNAEDGQSLAGIHCMVQTFNITVLCEEEYVVEPDALKFLVDHGFDFNKQYSKGIPYSKAETKIRNGTATLRNLFSQLLLHQVPVVFHNAVVDLGFIYENLYCPLPPTMGVFVSDLSEMFQGGIYDTKYITEFVARFPASYLDYVFHKSLRENAALPLDCQVVLTFPSYPEDYQFVSYRDCADSAIPRLNLHTDVLNAMRGLVCYVFAAHGWCPKKRKCIKSHDIDLILDTEEVHVVEKKKGRKRKRRRLGKKNEENCASVDNDKTDDHNDDDDNCDDITDDDNKCPGNNVDNDIMVEDVQQSEDGLEEENVLPDDEISVSVNGLKHASSSDNVCSGKETPSSENTVFKLSDKLETSSPCDTLDTTGEKISTLEKKSNHRQRGHNSKGHRAGFDSFMTGFAMATFVAKFGTKPKSSIVNGSLLEEWNLKDLLNKVYLVGKDIPLNITKTNFSKTSKCHNDKMERLMHSKTS